MRPLWKGSIGFGLVNIPVKLYSATEESNIPFVSLEKGSKSRIRYKKVAETTGKEVKQEDIVKAYETPGSTSSWKARTLIKRCLLKRTTSSLCSL